MNRRKIVLARGAGLCLLAASVSGLALSAPDSKAQATALLAEVVQTPQGARVASESVSKAQDALRRAEQMRASGDQKHAGMLEDTGLEWATVAQLLAKTAAREKQVWDLQAKTTELEDKIFRAQALIEQGVARRARAEEALRQLDEKIKPTEVKPAVTKGAKP